MSESDHIKHYLLVVDRLSSTGVLSEQYDDADDATRAYHDAEARYGTQNGYDVVLIGSDSIETVKRTHGSYFVDGVGIRESLIGESTGVRRRYLEVLSTWIEERAQT